MTPTNIIDKLQDYMLSAKNLDRMTAKHITPNTVMSKVIPTTLMPTLMPTIPTVSLTPPTVSIPRQPTKPKQNQTKATVKTIVKEKVTVKAKEKVTEKYYPKQKDSLFWCFYILKHGYFNYEMEINNNYFVVEKTEKYKYIELLRKNKDILKIHKIKPFTALEDDLANKDKITIKTFFALCVLEKLNVLLVDNRKYYELLCTDIDNLNPMHVIHKNQQTSNYYIEANATAEIIHKYQQTYYKLDSLDAKLKSVGSYKLDELLELCNKLNIAINSEKKQTKADIYNLLVLHY